MALLVAVLVLVALVLALRRPIRAYLKVRQMEMALPGPPTLPLIGNALHFMNVSEDEAFPKLRDMTWSYRHEMSRLSICGHLLLVVSNASDIEKVVKRRDFQDKSRFFYAFFDSLSRRGLVTLNGAEWRSHRRALQPAFHQHVLDRYMDIFTDEATAFVHRLTPSQELDVNADLMTLTARTFVRTALVGEVDQETEEHISTFIKFIHLVGHSFIWRATQPLLWLDFTYNHLTRAGREVRRLKAKVDAFIGGIVSRRRAELQRLQRLGADSSDYIKQRRTLIDILVDPKSEASEDSFEMTDSEIMDEVKIFFGAAAETTVAVLAWTFKVLSVRPEVQERMRSEIADQLAGKDALTTTDINELRYTEQVIKETMRLLPSVPVTARAVNEETELLGRTLPSHSTIVLNIYTCHRDPEHWPDPLRFDPDRFLPEECAKRHPFAYLPFSAGARNCIGGRYAMLAMKTLLAKVLPRYRVDPVADGHTEPADFPYASGVASRMPGGVRVVFTPHH